jgi:hypothetical protein
MRRSNQYTANTMKSRILKVTCAVTIAAFLTGASARVARAQFPYIPLPSIGSHGAEQVVAAAIVTAVIYSIARYEATEHQRQVAEMRARQSYAHMSVKRKQGMKSRKVRYIAVDTERGQKTSPKAKKTVMIYDTQTQKIASNTAYDVEKSPSVGTTAKIDNYSAEYVGSGL